MTADARRREWDDLFAERARTRAELAHTLDLLVVRARDPFGIKETIRRHPVAAAGVAAAVGAILVNLFVRGGPAQETRDAAEAPPRPEREPGPSPYAALRDVAIRVATPWVARWVAEKFGGAAPGRDAPDEPAARDVR